MTTEELKKAMAIIIDKNETTMASELIYKLWMDHNGYRIKNGNQVIRKNLDNVSKEVDIADYIPE